MNHPHAARIWGARASRPLPCASLWAGRHALPVAMGGDTLAKPKSGTALDTPWNVVVHDDPVNLMGYVTRVFMKVFGYPESRAARHMLEVHERGRSIVWTGAREKAEFYTQQLQAHQLKTTLEKVD